MNTVLLSLPNKIKSFLQCSYDRIKLFIGIFGLKLVELALDEQKNIFA